MVESKDNRIKLNQLGACSFRSLMEPTHSFPLPHTPSPLPTSSHTLKKIPLLSTLTYFHPLLPTPTYYYYFSYFENFYNLCNCVYE